MADEYVLPDVFVKPSVSVNELESREDFLRGAVDLRDIGVSSLTILRLGKKGQILDDAVVDTLDFLHIQAINLPQEERVQMVPNHSDDGKGYYFGRTHRMYGVSGFMVDSDLANGQGSHGSDFILGGKLYSYWKKTYESNLRIGQCIRKNQIVRISWRQSTMYGYVMNHNSSMDSMNPFQVNVNFGFLSIVEWEKARLPRVNWNNNDALVVGPPELNPKPRYIRGAISREGARRVLGLPAPSRYSFPEPSRRSSNVGQWLDSKKK